MLVIIFTLVTIGINLGVMQNNDSLVSSIVVELENDRKNTVDTLNKNFEGIVKELESADRATKQIILGLYTSSYNTLIQAIANQIFPMIESFDFDSAGDVINSILMTNKAIEWIKFVTSEKPTAADVYEFGKRTSNDSKNFIHRIKGEFSFLEIEMQVSLSGMQAINDVEDIFSKINKNNQELASRVEISSQQSINNAKNFANSLSQKGINKLIKQSVVFMVLVLALVCLSVALFIRRWITEPVTKIAEDLNEGADQVAYSSGQVSASSQSLSEGSSEQAASIEETSSSLEEMASMTKQNAENAGHADRLMKESNQVVDQANNSMSELTRSMQEISKASEETSKIIKNIDEIAFQTNLLALNAAVEAARAGEAGAGFAVVADEVRNLSMRATDAAKNTAELIEGTVKKVKDGGDLVVTTNEAFTQVTESASKVGELVGEIAAASNEQANGIDQLNKAVAEMDKVVQQNTASAEESASASEEMNAQAEQMKGVVYELVTLVGGNSKGNGAGGKEVTRLAEAAAYRELPVSEKTSIVQKVAVHRAKEVRPYQVIPLDEERDFKNF